MNQCRHIVACWVNAIDRLVPLLFWTCTAFFWTEIPGCVERLIFHSNVLL